MDVPDYCFMSMKSILPMYMHTQHQINRIINFHCSYTDQPNTGESVRKKNNIHIILFVPVCNDIQ